jgi:hypothetical protein
MKRSIIFLIALLAINTSATWAQIRSDYLLYPRYIGYHTGNRVGISFYDDGAIAGFNIGTDIRGEWPLGSGYNYIGDLTPMIGVELPLKDYDLDGKIDTMHSVCISRGPRNGQANEKKPDIGYFWGWNPRPGYRNNSYSSVGMSHLPGSWPPTGWADHPDWIDADGKPQWDGYFGRGIMNADQESYFVTDDQWDDELNFYTNKSDYFRPDSTDTTRHGMGLTMAVRGFQWAHFLAEDAIFWLYDVQNEGTTTYRKSVFGTVVGTLAGGDGDSGDDLGYFDINDNITYSWDNDNKGNKGQKVGYVAYAFLESPGNPYDGIDNDGDSQDPNSPHFVLADFDSVSYNVGSTVVLIDPATYERTTHTIASLPDTVYSMGVRFIITSTTKFREGHIASIVNGVSTPSYTAYDGIDNDLDGLIDENQAVHYQTRISRGFPTLAYKNYKTGAGVSDLLIDEKRDNDAGSMVSSWVKSTTGTAVLITHWSGDEDGDWDATYDDVGSDGLGPNDNDYPGPDADGTEGNGMPDQGEPNFGKTDPDESDQIGLTNFNFFAQSASPDMSDDNLLWNRMTPGRFDIIPSIPQDGDFIYSSGYFPMRPKQRERFSVALLFGETYKDVVRNKKIVQQIYNAGYKFPQPPRKPKLSLTTENGHVVLYWDGSLTENSRDFMTKRKDFEGYKIYKATDAGFRDSRVITDGFGVLSFDEAIAQFDLKDSIYSWFNASPDLIEATGGSTYYLGEETGIVHKYVDTAVVPGQRYFYAVCSYDCGDDTLNIYPAENSKYVYITSTGGITIDDNTGYITPGKPPIGYMSANADSLVKDSTFLGTGSGWIEIVDDRLIRDKNEYKVAFRDTTVQKITKDWSLIDLTSPDTLVVVSTNDTIFAKPDSIVTIPSGVEMTRNGKAFMSDTNFYIATYDTLVKQDTLFYGNTPIQHGFRVQLLNDTSIMKDSLRSYLDGGTSTPAPTYLFDRFVWTTTGPGVAYNGIKMPYDYTIEFYPDTVDSQGQVMRSIADTLYPNTSSNRIPAKTVNFKIYNRSTKQYINFVTWKTGTVSTVHNIYFKEQVGDSIKRTWRVNIYYTTANAPLERGGRLYLSTFKPFSHTDYYAFTTHGARIDNVVAKNQLNMIKVVPNPYVVANALEPALLSTQTSGRGERILRFTYVPPGSTISIYTVRGDLVATLHQDDLYIGDVKWNLRTSENLDAAYGVYIYYLEAPGIGTKTGKFALIK